jgi:4-aminobutyrate aminotransferase-like enzyme
MDPGPSAANDHAMTAAPTTTTNVHSASPSTVGTATPHTGTVGARLAGSPAIDAALKAIAAEIESARAAITDVRPPNPALKESYDSLMARAATVRGRPLLYPFLGSGAGNGALVELADGSVKWDLITGIGVHFFGHSDPDLIAASARGALGDTCMQGNLLGNADQYRFLETLLDLAKKNSRLAHAYIATSGAMANENALKVCFHKKFLDNLTSLARHADAKPEALLAASTPSQRVLAFKDCFMGRSLVMAQIGDNHAGREGLPNGVFVDYMPFWDPAAAERMGPGAAGKKRFIDMAVSHLEQYIHRYPGGHACFIFELVQGEGGFNVGDRDYLKALMDVCKAHGIAVWDDEIQTFGRTERMFAYEQFDLGDMVDVFCVGKMTQVCVTAWTKEFQPRTAILSGTFTGGSALYAVGHRVLERLSDGDFYGPQGRFARHHAEFRKQVHALAAKHPAWFPKIPEVTDVAGGVGGMMRFTPFGGKKEKVTAACKAIFDAGAIVFYCGHGPYHVRMLPPLPALDERDWPRVFACIEQGLAKVAS